MLDDRFKLPHVEVAARDRVYAYLAEEGPCVMSMIMEPSFNKSVKMLEGNIRLTSMVKIFCMVGVREMWQMCNPMADCPVGSWAHIDEMRQGSSQDIRVQAAVVATDMHLHHEGQEFECHQEIDKYIVQLKKFDDNPLAVGMIPLLPVVMERLIQVASGYQSGDERNEALEILVQGLAGEGEALDLDPGKSGFQGEVLKLVAVIQKQIDDHKEAHDE